MENESGKKPTHVARDNSIFDIDQMKELIMQVFLWVIQVSVVAYKICHLNVCLVVMKTA